MGHITHARETFVNTHDGSAEAPSMIYLAVVVSSTCDVDVGGWDDGWCRLSRVAPHSFLELHTTTWRSTWALGDYVGDDFSPPTPANIVSSSCHAGLLTTCQIVLRKGYGKTKSASLVGFFSFEKGDDDQICYLFFFQKESRNGRGLGVYAGMGRRARVCWLSEHIPFFSFGREMMIRFVAVFFLKEKRRGQGVYGWDGEDGSRTLA